MEICKKEDCTACKVCANICPTNAIKFKNDQLDNLYADIDKKKCVDCNGCRRVCPQLNEIELHTTINCYAAWSLDNMVRNESASGGIATEIYKEYLREANAFVGVEMHGKEEPFLKIGTEITDILKFKNSKYVYAEPNKIYAKVAKLLREGISVAMVGTPCQVAGMKKYVQFYDIDSSNLLLIDLVCHGTASYEYLRQHIETLEEKYNFNVSKCFFRDPIAHTYNFTFTLYENQNLKYAKKVHSDDVYQIGYHYGITYRTNCYSCHYAQKARVGDLTLADFGYVGKLASCSYDHKNVSCVLCNTEKGEKILAKMSRAQRIFLEKRPIEEMWNYESMLLHPTHIPKERIIFKKQYIKTRDFDKSMKQAVQKILFKNWCINNLRLHTFRRHIVSLIPAAIKAYIKEKVTIYLG